MSIFYYALVALHVLAALFWLGGMLFLGIVGAPVLRGVEPPELRQRLFHALGTRFRVAGWIAIAVLMMTGLGILHVRGLLRWDGVLGNPAFWGTGFGRALAIKLVAVTVMLAGSSIHDFVLGPAAGRLAAGSAAAITLRRRAAIVARANALLGLIVVLAAVRLTRGG